MPANWQPGQPTSWTLYHRQRGRLAFILHAVIGDREYAISLEGGMYAVFIGHDGRGERLSLDDFLTAQDAQEYAEHHAMD